jgi:hypothetical protein
MDIKQIKQFFFKAMVAGWARNGQKISIPEMPSYKAISFQEGDFRLLDCYCNSPDSPKSAGTTTIWHKNVPVWVMQFGGYYEKGAIRFLKRALLVNYETSTFLGGRGPSSFYEGYYAYYNKVMQNDFGRFSGREEIISRPAGDILGYHDYWGISLI